MKPNTQQENRKCEFNCNCHKGMLGRKLYGNNCGICGCSTPEKDLYKKHEEMLPTQELVIEAIDKQAMSCWNTPEKIEGDWEERCTCNCHKDLLHKYRHINPCCKDPRYEALKCEGHCLNVCKFHGGKFDFCSNGGCVCHFLIKKKI